MQPARHPKSKAASARPVLDLLHLLALWRFVAPPGAIYIAPGGAARIKGVWSTTSCLGCLAQSDGSSATSSVETMSLVFAPFVAPYLLDIYLHRTAHQQPKRSSTWAAQWVQRRRKRYATMHGRPSCAIYACTCQAMFTTRSPVHRGIACYPNFLPQLLVRSGCAATILVRLAWSIFCGTSRTLE